MLDEIVVAYAYWFGGEGPSVPGVAAAVFAVGMVSGAVALAAGWRGARRCRVCSRMTTVLRGAARRAALDDGERAEERVGSVRYEVRACPEHGPLKIAHAGRERGYEPCPGCSRRTARKRWQAIRDATFEQEGLRLHVQRCEHCGHEAIRDKVLPRRVPKATPGDEVGGGRRRGRLGIPWSSPGSMGARGHGSAGSSWSPPSSGGGSHHGGSGRGGAGHGGGRSGGGGAGRSW